MKKASPSKNRKSRNKNKKLRFVLIVAVLGYVLPIFISQQIEFETRKKALAETQQQIEQQEQIRERLTHRMEVAGSPEYLERIAREQLGLARPDEIIFYDATLKK
jgi:cell division protein FtsL